ncbi:MAG: YHS domain-containing protein [Nitrososphaeria archaeon]|nr:YHS domain-containing protein [Nitrososphaeria archaeon]
MVRDLVCGMEVDPKKTKYKLDYGGNTYYFCSESCLKSFQQNPSNYVTKKHEHHGCCC